jgi:hypothetical protein
VDDACETARPATTLVPSLTSTLVQPYPVTVNGAPPAQEPGVARRPSGSVACAASPPPPPGPLRTVLDGLGRLLRGLPV